jgi:hypothetical protein
MLETRRYTENEGLWGGVALCEQRLHLLSAAAASAEALPGARSTPTRPVPGPVLLQQLLFRHSTSPPDQRRWMARTLFGKHMRASSSSKRGTLAHVRAGART